MVITNKKVTMKKEKIKGTDIQADTKDKINRRL